jgi:hypothetical protein
MNSVRVNDNVNLGTTRVIIRYDEIAAKYNENKSKPNSFKGFDFNILHGNTKSQYINKNKVEKIGLLFGGRGGTVGGVKKGGKAFRRAPPPTCRGWNIIEVVRY